MNHKQVVVVGTGFVVAMLAILFPPHEESPVWYDPVPNTDHAQLLMRLIVIALITIVAVLGFSDTPRIERRRRRRRK